MITYVKIKNFKSFKDVEFKLNRTQNKTNKFAAVYGENGSGKTNLVEVFKFLQELVYAKCYDRQMVNIPKELNMLKEQLILNVPTDLKTLGGLQVMNLNEYRLINESEPTEIEYGFKINDKEGFYYIKFVDQIIEEKLYYIINEKSSYYFQIFNKDGKVEKKLNKQIFFDDKYFKEIEENIEKYWGKYSFLSLMLNEYMNKNIEYLNQRVSKKMDELLYKIFNMNIFVNKKSNNTIPDFFTACKNHFNLREGKIKISQLKILRKYEKILKIFFIQAYSDIKNVFYKVSRNEDNIKYELYFTKNIGGDLKDVPVNCESDGTKRIIEKFYDLIAAINGETVIIDEIDNGIHDLLMKNIIISLLDEITGQLIITTHNTVLLEELPKESIYVIDVDYLGNKKIKSIKDYKFNVQQNHNVRDLYLKGVFGGIPHSSYIDFEEIKYYLGEDVNE